VGFYKSIAAYYDDIFPYSPIQKDFVLSSCDCENKNKYFLDIGCGTGNLTLELSKWVKNIVGIDSNLEMIGLAKEKISGYGDNIKFRCLSMLEIKNHFPPNSFDLMLAFGNTLAHLKSTDEVGNFFDQAKRILKAGGVLLLQIVNFDQILKNNVRSLPLIENKEVRFERYYEYHMNPKVIDFNTILTVKKEHRIIKNSLRLIPLLKNALEMMLHNTGYQRIKFFGGFNRENWSEKSPALILEAN
jgi:glycine/sarcosine N-methyltransferase